MKYYGKFTDEHDLITVAKGTSIAQEEIVKALDPEQPGAIQPVITATGVLKGEGGGVITAALKDDITALGIPAQDTTYTAGSGLSLNTTVFNHSNSVTPGSAVEGGETRTLAYGGAFNVPGVTYDAQGHITAGSSITLTLPESDNTNQTIKCDGTSFGDSDVIDIIAGSNVTLTPDTGSKVITIAAQDTIYTHPEGTAASKESGLYKFSTDATSHVASVTAVTKADITGLGIPAQDTTYELATESNDGLVTQLPSGDGTTKLLNGENLWGTNIVNVLTSTSTTDVLAAAAGKVLDERITNLESRGRFLSTWDATTGLPFTNPSSMPYIYRTGDYFVVGKVGDTNYKPSGTTYSGTASTEVETETIAVNDTYYFDGTAWSLSGGSVVKYDEQLSTTSTNAAQNKVITAAINTKIDTAGTGLSKSGTTLNHTNSVTAVASDSLLKVAYDEQGHITSSTAITKSDITGLGIPPQDTTYSAGTGLSLSGTTFNHSNSVTAGTASEGGSARTLGWSGTFNIPSITYDAQGHITAKGSTTITMPANPNTDTTNTCGAGNSTAKLYLVGRDAQSTGTSYSNSAVYATNGSLYSTKVYGAVWNDFAEFRKGNAKPGTCVCEVGDGTLAESTERLQAGASIVSDTFGFAIGETDECKLPIAVAGRVLAYFGGEKSDFKPGDAVCAGQFGRIWKMTREEIKEYPDRIVGYVSEFPDYEEWGTGNVKVNGRIWIKVK